MFIVMVKLSCGQQSSARIKKSHKETSTAASTSVMKVCLLVGP